MIYSSSYRFVPLTSLLGRIRISQTSKERKVSMSVEVRAKIKETGEEGLLFPGDMPFFWSVQTEDKLVEGLMFEAVEVIGETEFSIDKDPDKCGVGTPKCCIYIVNSGYFECARSNPQLRGALEAKFASGTMRADYRPTKPYPACRNER